MILKHLAEATERVVSYLAATFGFLQDVEWTTVGASVLLIARLIQDVPAALEVIKKHKEKKRAERNE